MTSRFKSTAIVIALCFYSALGQIRLPVSDTGWRLWLDKDAQWENDSIYLPADVDLSKLPINPPTGGWQTLDINDIGIAVTLPSTVEQHYWGTNGYRPYKGEYAYEEQDTMVKNGNYLGVSWWWHDFNVPAAFKGKRAVLFIRGARLRAEVFLNKKLVAYNIITETSFTCDVSKAIRPGATNQLAIRITNPGGRLDWVDTELLTWGKTQQKFHKSHGFGGLDRGITITATYPLHLNDVWVINTPEAKAILANALVANASAQHSDVQVRFEIRDPSSVNKLCSAVEKTLHLAPSSESFVESPLSWRDAEIWSAEHPTLYTLRVTVSEKRKRWSDTRERTFGFRWFDVDGIGKNATLQLNGKRIRLTSAISWGFWGINGLWPTKELAEREVRAAKALGMNCIQFHRNIGKTDVLDAHDRLGLYRYMEPGGGQTSFGEKLSLYAASPKSRVDDSGENGDPTTFAERYMEEKIIRMVRDHRSHPSLLLYCIQNEIHPDHTNPRVFRVLRRIHQEDPSRIVVLKSGFPSGSPSVNQAWMRPYSDIVHADTGDGYSGWWDDHTVGGPGVWRDEMYKNPTDFTHRSVNDKEIVMWGEMLGAAAPDNHEAMVAELKEKKLSSYDLKEHEEILTSYKRFIDRWGFRNAFTAPSSLFEAIGNKSYDFWGRVIETARLAESNDYFVISGWESTAIENHSGLLDNLRNFKGDPTLISKRLVPMRLVIKTPSLVFSRGSSMRADLFLLNETQAPHPTKANLWLQAPSENRVSIGQFEVTTHQSGKFVYPIAAGIPLPKFETEGKYVLSAELVGDARANSEDTLLVIDPAPQQKLPTLVGIVSALPALLKPFELLPGVRVEQYDRQKSYDVVIVANRFTRPYETRTDPNTEIEGTDDDELYRSINYGPEGTIEFFIASLPKGRAKVTLKFAELFQNAEGMRVFDVALNGDVVLKNFDVFKEAGGKNKAIDRSFEIHNPGYLHITFPRVPKPSARICGIKIEAGDSVIAIRCGGTEYRDKGGVLWKTYAPPIQFETKLLERVRMGMPLLVLTEGELAIEKCGQELGSAGAFQYLGYVGEARASWMGSWYFVRKHQVYDGLPVDCSMDSYYQVPVTNSGAILLEGKCVEIFTGYSRDHDRNIGAASFSTGLGKGKIVFHSIPGVVSGLNGESKGLHPVMLQRLMANSLKYLVSKKD